MSLTYLSEVFQQVFIVFHILQLVSQFLGCVQIFQRLKRQHQGEIVGHNFYFTHHYDQGLQLRKPLCIDIFAKLVDFYLFLINLSGQVICLQKILFKSYGVTESGHLFGLKIVEAVFVTSTISWYSGSFSIGPNCSTFLRTRPWQRHSMNITPSQFISAGWDQPAICRSSS